MRIFTSLWWWGIQTFSLLYSASVERNTNFTSFMKKHAGPVFSLADWETREQLLLYSSVKAYLALIFIFAPPLISIKDTVDPILGGKNIYSF